MSTVERRSRWRPGPAGPAVAAIGALATCALAGSSALVAASASAAPLHAADPTVVVGSKSAPALEICGLKPVVERPARIILGCADGGAFGEHLAWKSWGAERAYARGVYTWNPCKPYCAATKPKEWGKTAATFTLGSPARTEAGWLFETLVVRLSGKIPKNMNRVLTFSEKPVT